MRIQSGQGEDYLAGQKSAQRRRQGLCLISMIEGHSRSGMAAQVWSARGLEDRRCSLRMVAGACKERTQEKGVMQAHDGPKDLSKFFFFLPKKKSLLENLRETLRVGAAISTHLVNKRVQAQS
jgi:hypothetical protein